MWPDWLRSAFRSSFAYYSPMGGERQSTTRRRPAGEICCARKILSLPQRKFIQ